MLAGVTATVTCFPLDVMRTRVMGPGGHVYGGVISTFSNLLQKEGVSSMYVGLLPAVISMAPAGAVFYGVYDLLKVRLGTCYSGKTRLGLQIPCSSLPGTRCC